MKPFGFFDYVKLKLREVGQAGRSHVAKYYSRQAISLHYDELVRKKTNPDGEH